MSSDCCVLLCYKYFHFEIIIHLIYVMFSVFILKHEPVSEPSERECNTMKFQCARLLRFHKIKKGKNKRQNNMNENELKKS